MVICYAATNNQHRAHETVSPQEICRIPSEGVGHLPAVHLGASGSCFLDSKKERGPSGIGSKPGTAVPSARPCFLRKPAVSRPLNCEILPEQVVGRWSALPGGVVGITHSAC